MLEALLTDIMSPEEMADLAKGKLRPKIPQLVEALEGRVRNHHRFLLRQHLDHLAYLQEVLAHLHRRIDELVRPYRREVELIASITEFDIPSAQHVFVEIGGDIIVFPTAGHLASWAKICPGNNESGGKRLSGHTGRGNRWLRGILVQLGWAATRKKGSYLKAFYHRLAARRGKKRTVVAVAHQQVCLLHQVLATGKPYEDPGEAYRNERQQRALERRLVRGLTSLGYRVELHPEPAAA